MVRENEDNPKTGVTTVWTYDNAGNIKTRTEYVYTTGTPSETLDTVTYTYGNSNWGDLLTKYDGYSITYDSIGNPTSYYNGTRWAMTWEHGRQLATMSDTSTSTVWTNTYNSAGLRTSRTDGTTTYTYYYEGGRLSAIKRNDLNMWIIYDENGPVTLKYGSGTFHYVTNLQGDVVAIVGNQGQTLVEYTYDAWGKVLSITGDYAYNLGIHNPILYRGYIYDHETGLYYCQSRYYDPETGRFLNADALTSTGQGTLGNNMFAYCLNNPVSMRDDDGYLGLWALCGIGAVVGGLINYAGQVIENYTAGKTGAEAWTDVNVGEIAGAVFSGAISVIPGSAGWGDVVDAVGSNIIEHGVNSLVYGDEFSFSELGQEIVTDYAMSVFLPEIIPTSSVPRFIRDIKDEARAVGVKGTRALQTYLSLSQVEAVVVNEFYSDTNDRIYATFGIG